MSHVYYNRALSVRVLFKVEEDPEMTHMRDRQNQTEGKQRTSVPGGGRTEK